MMTPKITVVMGGGCIQKALCNRLTRFEGLEDSQVRSSAVVMSSLEEMNEVCKGAEIVYLLSALDIPAVPDKASLRIFRKGVTRVLDCCQESDVSSLVFVSSSRVGSVRKGGDLAVDENSPFVKQHEDEIAHAIAMAEAEVLKTSGTQNPGGSSLYTCALRPAPLFGIGEDRSIHRVLPWVGWGLNRVAMGPRDVEIDMLFGENLVEAQLLAGVKLAEGVKRARTGGPGWNNQVPICSGQAYNISDGKRYNPQGMMDDILERLDFPTAKCVRVPRMLALVIAGVAELVWKVGLSKAPLLTRAEVRMLTESRRVCIARVKNELGYEPSVDPGNALKLTVESLKGQGWGRHTFAIPGLGWWISIILGMWLFAIAAFESICPAFLAPLQKAALYLGLCLYQKMWILRLVFVLSCGVHILEGVYAFWLAQNAGHRDTAPLWLFQTTLLGFTSLRLLLRLLS